MAEIRIVSEVLTEAASIASSTTSSIVGLTPVQSGSFAGADDVTGAFGAVVGGLDAALVELEQRVAEIDAAAISVRDRFASVDRQLAAILGNSGE